MRIEERPSVGGYDQPSSYAYNLVATFWNCSYEKWNMCPTLNII